MKRQLGKDELRSENPVIIGLFVSTLFIPIPPMGTSLGPLESQEAGPFSLTGIHPASTDDNQGDPSRHRFFSA